MRQHHVKHHQDHKDQTLKFLYLKLLAQVGLARMENRKIWQGAIHLINCQKTINLDLENWDHSQFFDYLKSAINIKLNQSKYLEQLYPIYNSIRQNPFNIGSTFRYINKKIPGTLAATLFNYSQRCLPGQMFFRMGRGRDFKSPSLSELNMAKQILTENPFPLFIHSSYLINLCDPYTVKNKTSDKWVLDLARDDLINADYIGGRGVVV